MLLPIAPPTWDGVREPRRAAADTTPVTDDPSSNVVFENMTLDGASILERPCDFGDLGNRASDITGGSVDMCN